MDDDADLETQQLIDAVHTFFTNVGILELKIPFWKVFPTPTWRRYVEALDTIVKYAQPVLFSRDKTLYSNSKVHPRGNKVDVCNI